MNEYIDPEWEAAKVRANTLLKNLTGKNWLCYIWLHKMQWVGGSVIPHYMCTRCGAEYIDDNLDLQ